MISRQEIEMDPCLLRKLSNLIFLAWSIVRKKKISFTLSSDDMGKKI